MFSCDFMKNEPKMSPNVAPALYLRSTPEKKTFEKSKSTSKMVGIRIKLFLKYIDLMGRTLGQRGPGHTRRRTPQIGPKGPHEGKLEESASHCFAPFLKDSELFSSIFQKMTPK